MIQGDHEALLWRLTDRPPRSAKGPKLRVFEAFVTSCGKGLDVDAMDQPVTPSRPEHMGSTLPPPETGAEDSFESFPMRSGGPNRSPAVQMGRVGTSRLPRPRPPRSPTSETVPSRLAGLGLLGRRRWSEVNLRCQSGFTLIELLVVIAIIGVLAGLTMPALSSAKARAGSIRCLSNLRQIGIALRLYADENEGRLPRLATASQPGLTNAAGAVMPRLLAPATSPELFRCPQDRQGVFQQTGSSYEWNPALNGRLLHRLNREDTGTGDHATYLMRDAEAWHARGTRNAVFADGHAGKEGRGRRED